MNKKLIFISIIIILLLVLSIIFFFGFDLTINQINSLKLRPLIDGHNKIDADRINLVFVLIDFSNESYAKDWIRKELAFENDKIVTVHPEHDWYSDKDNSWHHSPEQFILNFGLFSIEPFKSNKNKFNLWYIIVDLNNNETEYNNFLNNELFGGSVGRYLGSYTDLNFINPIIINAMPIENYVFLTQGAGLPSFFEQKEINKNYLKFGYFVDRYGIDSNGIIKVSSNEQTSYLWMHELGHSIIGLKDEYEGKSVEPYYGYPNCARDLEEAKEWWGDKVGNVDSSYYDLIEISEKFYNETKNEKNVVSVPSFEYCGEEDVRVGYIRGWCQSRSDANVIRPTNNSLMVRASNCFVFGSVNRERAEQVLNLFSGK